MGNSPSVDKGVTLSRGGRHAEAVAVFDEILCKNGRDKPLGDDGDLLLTHLGISLLALGRAQDSLAVLDRAMTHHPSPEALYHRGLAKHALRDNVGAVADLTAFLAPEPGKRPCVVAEAWANRGVVLLDLGRAREALSDMETAISLSEGERNKAVAPEFLLTRALCKEAMGRCAEAVADCTAALAVSPRCARGFLIRGRMKAALGLLPEALANFDMAAQFGLPEEAEAARRRAMEVDEVSQKIS
jgi:tetratricopeptide (TPR) repeat protein